MQKGIIYGVSVGPGDPELLTLKAVRILQKVDIIAVPDSGNGNTTALEIVSQWVEQDKLRYFHTPMIRDREKLQENYHDISEQLSKLLDEGKHVAFITLGDATIYSTYSYIHERLTACGYDARFIPGVPSFCAAAAALGTALCEGGEMLHVIPVSHESAQKDLALPGTKVFMKAGRHLAQLQETLAKSSEQHVAMVERCGMSDEKIVPDITDFEGKASYFTVVIAKEQKK